MGFWSSQLHYWAVGLLALIGIYGMLVRPNLMRKLMAMNILQVAVIFFYISLAAKKNGTPPIILSGTTQPYVNPLPHALMLTAIVVGVATTGVALALLIKIRKRFNTLEEPELLERMRK